MIVKRDFPYGAEGKNRPLHIWLPESYARSEERYPVLYFLDGHNLFPMTMPPTANPGDSPLFWKTGPRTSSSWAWSAATGMGNG